MKRRSFIPTLAAIFGWWSRLWGSAHAQPTSPKEFKGYFPADGNREPDENHLEMMGQLDQDFSPRRVVQVIRRKGTSRWGEPIIISTYRVALSDNTTPSKDIPEFNSITEAEVWGGVRIETIDPKLITNSWPPVPMPVFPEPPDLSTLPRCIPPKQTGWICEERWVKVEIDDDQVGKVL